MTNQRQYTPRLRLLSAALATAMAMTMLPVAAFAEDVIDYDLSVAGQQAHSYNAENILGDGTARFDGSTLTLNGNISVPGDKRGIDAMQGIGIAGTGTLTALKKVSVGILAMQNVMKIAAGADITLDGFATGISGAGVEVNGNLTLRNMDFGISGQGVTIQSGGKVTIENNLFSVSGGGAEVYGTLEIHGGLQAVEAGGIAVHTGGKAIITGVGCGMSGRSVVDGGTLSVSADDCINNGEVIFDSGTLILESASGSPLALYPAKLNVQPDEFWYRTEKDGAWTHVTDGSWVRPSDAAYIELTTNDPTEYYPEPDDPIIDDGGSGAGIALAVAGGAVAAGVAGFGAYELTTRAILKNLLPAGADIPATRGELAVLLWQNAGKPEPAAQPAFADVTDAQTAKAAQWCTEQGLLETEDGAFRPEQRVAKYRVIQVWKQAAAQQK